jgi:hypothetical protein
MARSSLVTGQIVRSSPTEVPRFPMDSNEITPTSTMVSVIEGRLVPTA